MCNEHARSRPTGQDECFHWLYSRRRNVIFALAKKRRTEFRGIKNFHNNGMIIISSLHRIINYIRLGFFLSDRQKYKISRNRLQKFDHSGDSRGKNLVPNPKKPSKLLYSAPFSQAGLALIVCFIKQLHYQIKSYCIFKKKWLNFDHI